MKVREMMTRDVRTCRPETNLAEAASEMWLAIAGRCPS